MKKETLNGIQIAFDASESDGAPVLFLHGFPLDHSIWDEVRDELEEDARPIVMDLRGHGESEAPAPGYTLLDMADDVAALLDFLNVDRALIAGHSMGGYLALAFARRYPERLSGLALISTQAAADSPERRAARLAQAEEVLAKGTRVVADAMASKLAADPSLEAPLHALMMKTSPQGVAGALHAMASRADSTEFLPNIRVPTVILAGLQDAILPVERSREMAAKIPNARLITIVEAGHMPMMEAPELVAGALKFILE